MVSRNSNREPMSIRLSTIGGVVLLAAALHVSAGPAVEPRTACELLTKKEVAAVQGEPFSAAKLTANGAKSQCFYELPSFVKSVSVDVLRDGAARYWEENFSEEAQERRDEEREEEGEKKKDGPRFVKGIGREAYWTGNSTGSLYVFAGDTVLRVSVGGAGTTAEKIERTRKLAAKALKRL
jgi:hypothetical protein